MRTGATRAVLLILAGSMATSTTAGGTGGPTLVDYADLVWILS